MDIYKAYNASQDRGEWRSQIQFAIDANGFVPKEKNDDDKSTSSACIFH